MSWQRSQLARSNARREAIGLGPPSHDALLIGETVLAKPCVDGFQIITLWERHEVVASRIADQIFDTAFLPAGMHIGKERLEAIDTLEVQKDLVLSATVSLQHLEDGWFEIIVDRHAWHSSPELKGMALTEQKGFLPLSGEAFDKHGWPPCYLGYPF